MTRFWASWWSGNYADEGCTMPPFQYWESGSRDRASGERDDLSICAAIDAPDAESIWPVVRKHFPDYEERFCGVVADDYVPGDRFPGFENRCGLNP